MNSNRHPLFYCALVVVALFVLEPSARSEDGKTTSGLTEGSAFGRAVNAGTDGSFLVAGRIWNGTDFDVVLFKHLEDGSRDPSFGVGGKVTLDIAQWDDFGRAIAVSPEGKILVGGYFQSGTDLDFFVAQFDANGAPDTLFGQNGIAIADFGGGEDRAQHLTLLEDGSISLTGYSKNPETLELAEVRFDQNGIPDPTFGVEGQSKSPSDEPEYDLGCTVITFADGATLTCGLLWNSADFDFALRRYLIDGNPDAAFGLSGTATADFFAGDDEARCLTVLPDGKILAVGDAWDGDSFEIAIARFLSDGTLDTTFGVDTPDDDPGGGSGNGNGGGGGGGSGGGSKRSTKKPTDTWSALFTQATSTYNLYAGYGYYYYAAAYYSYYYGLANYNFYNSRGNPANAQLQYYSGLATFYLYSLLESGDPVSANVYYYYYLALAYYYYYAALGDFYNAGSYYNAYIGYAFGA